MTIIIGTPTIIDRYLYKTISRLYYSEKYNGWDFSDGWTNLLAVALYLGCDLPSGTALGGGGS